MKYFLCIGLILVALVLLMPRLLQRKFAHETNACAALKIYVKGQKIYKKENYSQINGLPKKQFASSFKVLAGKAAHLDNSGAHLTLVPDVFADATKTISYGGYYFIDVSVEDSQKEFALFAVPSKYGETGRNCFWINQNNILRMKDLKGRVPIANLLPDSTWVQLK